MPEHIGEGGGAAGGVAKGKMCVMVLYELNLRLIEVILMEQKSKMSRSMRQIACSESLKCPLNNYLMMRLQ